MMMAHLFEGSEDSAKVAELEKNPSIGFEKDFLRWMLSDGAGAALLRNRPNDKGLSLKIEWIEGRSFAHRFETCMYSSSDKEADGSVRSWKQYTPTQWAEKAVFSMKQDVKLLSSNIVPLGGEFLGRDMRKDVASTSAQFPISFLICHPISSSRKCLMN
jgi:3-oxoacyl-[acyl-carrier-protein] synthase-3